MAYTLGNKCAKNLCKRTVLLQLIIENVVTCFFLEHSVYLLLSSCDRNDVTPTTWSRALLIQGEVYHKMSSAMLLVNGTNGYVHAWRWKNITLNIWWNKTGTFSRYRLFSEPATFYRRQCVVSHHFRCCYFKANELSKSAETRKVICIWFLKVCWCCLPEIIKISRCLTKLQLAKVSSFFKIQCRAVAIVAVCPVNSRAGGH